MSEKRKYVLAHNIHQFSEWKFRQPRPDLCFYVSGHQDDYSKLLGLSHKSAEIVELEDWTETKSHYFVKRVRQIQQEEMKRRAKQNREATLQEALSDWSDGYAIKLKKEFIKKQRKPIRRISAARAKRLSEYAKLKRCWLRGKTCQMCLSKKVDVHHSRGRTGRLLCMVELWIPLCRFHHNKVKEDPAWAYKHELLGPYGSYNSSKK